MIENNIIKSIYGNKVDTLPIWLMRQAGRYLPEYRQLREKAKSFLGLCTNPDLATEVTLQPLKRFALDAAILFSDILVVPDAMGLGLYFVETEGPKFKKPIQVPADIDNLRVDAFLEKLEYVFQTIRNLKVELPAHTPLIGFSGSPFTLACYMLEGSSSVNYLQVKKWIYNNPEAMHKLLDKLASAVALYLNAQIVAGVDVVMLFDSWGGILSTDAYLKFSLPYSKKVLSMLKDKNTGKKVARILFTKGGSLWLEDMGQCGVDVIGVDWTIDVAKARGRLPNMTLQGNLDPALLAVASRDTLKLEIERIINNYWQANNFQLTNYIFNLGHGILPSTPIDNVQFLVDHVHEFATNLSKQA